MKNHESENLFATENTEITEKKHAGLAFSVFSAFSVAEILGFIRVNSQLI
jgi:hypothetical protein